MSCITVVEEDDGLAQGAATKSQVRIARRDGGLEDKAGCGRVSNLVLSLLKWLRTVYRGGPSPFDLMLYRISGTGYTAAIRD